jgi:hypothetical protein
MSIGVGSFHTQLDIHPCDFILLTIDYLCIICHSTLCIDYVLIVVNSAKMCIQQNFVSLIVLNNFMKT